MQRQIILAGGAIVNFRLRSLRRLSRIVTGSVRGARNPLPTPQRHNLLQFFGATADVLARGVQKYSCAPPEHPLRAERTGMLESVCGGLWSEKDHKKRNWRPAVIRNRGNPE